MELFGYPVEPARARLDRLEAALQQLPRWWGPGEPICYPRPLQEKVPIIVGGGGERRTLRLVAQYADACNLFGDRADVAAKVAVLRAHCEDVGRDPATLQVTHFAEAGVLRGERSSDVTGTTEELIGRYRELAEVGVQHCVVGLHTDGSPTDVEAFGPVIEAFRVP